MNVKNIAKGFKNRFSKSVPAVAKKYENEFNKNYALGYVQKLFEKHNQNYHFEKVEDEKIAVDVDYGEKTEASKAFFKAEKAVIKKHVSFMKE